VCRLVVRHPIVTRTTPVTVGSIPSALRAGCRVVAARRLATPLYEVRFLQSAPQKHGQMVMMQASKASRCWFDSRCFWPARADIGASSPLLGGSPLGGCWFNSYLVLGAPVPLHAFSSPLHDRCPLVCPDPSGGGVCDRVRAETARCPPAPGGPQHGGPLWPAAGLCRCP
jgi:hypothetical protein